MALLYWAHSKKSKKNSSELQDCWSGILLRIRAVVSVTSSKLLDALSQVYLMFHWVSFESFQGKPTKLCYFRFAFHPYKYVDT